mmetsp:Transcript_72947/g.152293  ORF Transcript_72947/g.152293 Transcript_72947/m.152293 type:complete len:650 (+) Transcript_72947:226-2175(+)
MAFDPTDYGEVPPPGADMGGVGDMGGPFDAYFDAFAAEGTGAPDDKELRDAVLILIDCTSRDALSPLKEGRRSLVAEALSAAATLLKRKVIASPEDKVGVALYGVREKLNPNGFEGIRLLQELDRPSAQRIKQLELEIARSPESFEERYGYGRKVMLSDVFWTSTTIFNLAASPKQFEPRIWLFTSTDTPCGDGVVEQQAAETRARDLRDLGVQVEFFPLPMNGAAFAMDRFWDRVVPVDDDDYVGKASVTLDNLDRWIRMKEHRKRTLQRLPFQLAPGTEMAVSIYCTTIQARIPYPVYLLNENNKLLKSETKHICSSTGAILHPTEDIETYVEVADRRVPVSRAEVTELKNFGEPGIKLLGFKALSSLQPHHRIFHAYFMYPNEKVIQGSAALCQALIKKMLEKKLLALVRYIARRNAEPALVALIPQAEEVDEDGIQVKNPGFHMIRLPWAEEIRKVDLPLSEQVAPAATSPALLTAAKNAILGMKLEGFRPGCAENPVLQRHYAALQALALGEDKPAETVDVLQPDSAAIEEKAPLFHAWKSAIDAASPAPAGSAAAAAAAKKRAWTDRYNGVGAGAAGGEPPFARARREGPVGAPHTIEDMRTLQQNGDIERLTVAALKDWLKAQGVVASGKKADLLARARAIL